MNSIVNKHYVFITSAGRTGTKFLGDNLSSMIEDSFCIHEPDVLNFDFLSNLKKIHSFGIKHMIIDRIRGKSGIRILSQSRISKSRSDEEIWARIKLGREKYWGKLNEKLIIESYYGWYGLLPVIRQNMPEAKMVVVLRHPASWIVSNMNWQVFHGQKDFVKHFGSDRLNPSLIENDKSKEEWRDFDQFEKLCWTWNAINTIALSDASKDKNTLVVKFEELFDQDQGPVVLGMILAHISKFSSHKFIYTLKSELLKTKIHSSQDRGHLAYDEWDDKKKNILLKHCSSLMSELDYGISD